MALIKRAVVALVATATVLLPAVTASAGTATATSDPCTWRETDPSTGITRIYCGFYDGSAYTDRGDTGRRVKEVQALLRHKGYSVGSSGIDGVFGSATERAVRSFQASRGLAVDGIVGDHTWWRLRWTQG